jgi:hypothetical protein
METTNTTEEEALLRVNPEQRFTKAHPCPICGGHDAKERGAGERCYGFMSSDGEWSHCSREEYAGSIDLNPKTEGFPHKLTGECKCGTQHGPDNNVTKLHPKSRKGRIVKTYDYTDEIGELLFQTVRYEDPKDFRQRRPNGSGGWEWNLTGVRRVLYHLPELLKADKDTTIYLCEGEKDVDRLREEDLVATTNPMGAKKWRKEYTDILAGRYVVVLEDNDKDGRVHVEAVASALSGKAASAKVLKLPGLPEKGDVFDYFEAGGTAAELERIAGEVEEWDAEGGAQEAVIPFVRADLSQALRDGVDPPEALVPGILLKGMVHSIYSAGGTGKTFKMLYLVQRVIEQGLSVLIFDMENGLRIIAERLEELGVTPEQSKLIHYYPFPQMPLEEDVINAFEGLLDEVKPALVVFDSWVNCLAACGLSENDSIDIATWADAYSQKARRREIASLILDHVPKEGNTARGSGRKLDYVDVQWELRNPQPFNRKTVGRIDLHLRKDREGWLPGIHTFSVGGGEEGFIFKPSEGLLLRVNEEGLLPTDRTVKEALKSFDHSGARDKDWKEAAEARGIKRSTYYHARHNLIEKMHVEKVMDKYFIKDLQNDESNEVQNSPIGLLDQGQTEKSNWYNDPRSWTNGPPPETSSVDEDKDVLGGWEGDY